MLLWFAEKLDVPISFGFVNGNGRPATDISPYLIQRKLEGARISNPVSYFEDPSSWECLKDKTYLRIGLDGREEPCQVKCEDCVSACSYLTTYHINHPFEFFKNIP